MMLKLLLVVGCASIAATAPLKEQDTPLVRVKRADEVISFGNHQNNARMKKSGPIPPKEIPSENEKVPSGQDEKATVKATSEDIKETNQETSQQQDGNALKNELVEETYTILDEPAVPGQDSPLDGVKVEEVIEEKPKEDITGEEEENEKVETKQTLKEDKTEEEELAEVKEKPADEEDALKELTQGKTESMEEGDLFGDEKLWEELYDYYYDNLPLDDIRQKRDIETSKRDKRSLPKALTAENMDFEGMQKTRSKRDLELGGPEDFGYFYGDEVPAEEVSLEDLPYNDEMKDEVTKEDIANYMNKIASIASIEEEAEEYFGALEAEREEVAEEEARERLMMLGQLYGDAQEGAEYLGESYGEYEPEPSFDGNRELAEYLEMEPEAIQPSYEEEPIFGYGDATPYDEMMPSMDLSSQGGDEVEIDYLPIVYDGQPGLFIPIGEDESSQVRKRSEYPLSLVPGTKKRNFYPAEEEPDKWGAFIDAYQEEKRNQGDMYDRIFKLAEALKERQGESQEEVFSDEKKK